MLSTLCDIAVEAGQAILPYFNEIKENNIIIKDDNSPVTLADKAAHTIIQSHLEKTFPNIPIISEEGVQTDYLIRKNWKNFFLVDPLDGTKEFIKKNPEYTVNIAYIKNQHVIAGVIYAPSLDLLYFAEKNKGAYRKMSCDRTAKKIFCSKTAPNIIRVLCSKSHMNHQTRAHIETLANTNALMTIPTGSSLKFCKIAEGEADYYPRLSPAMEWDIAAGHIIAEEAGAVLCKFQNNSEILYNSESLLVAGFRVRSESLLKLF
jgi:3'(2'), 5'-bisphosphate nucleotidase